MQSERQKREIEMLEAILVREQQELLSLRQKIEQDKQSRSALRKTTFNNERDAKFYQENVKRIDIEELIKKSRDLNADQLNIKREQVKSLRRELKEFEGIEPTNESLQRKIDELQKSRLSLDMSFDDML
jgi:uncharacterized protein YigA (DUF484 family)